MSFSVTEQEQQAYSAEAEAEAVRILGALDAEGDAMPACAHSDPIRLDTYGNLMADAAEDCEDWAEDIGTEWAGQVAPEEQYGHRASSTATATGLQAPVAHSDLARVSSSGHRVSSTPAATGQQAPVPQSAQPHVSSTAALADSDLAPALQIEGKPMVDPPELDAEGLVRDTDETPGWIPGTFPTIFQNETGEQHNYLLKKPD